LAPFVKPPPAGLPVGSVVERRQGGRTFLIVQEASGVSSTVESWEDGIDVANRILGRLNHTLEAMNADMSTFNDRLTAGLRETGAKIASNQRLLDEIVKGRP
jgi:aminoglycoside phosphotransferase